MGHIDVSGYVDMCVVRGTIAAGTLVEPSQRHTLVVPLHVCSSVRVPDVLRGVLSDSSDDAIYSVWRTNAYTR